MRESIRTSLKDLLTVVFGLLSLPMLIFGGYFLVCWFRIHTSDVYYVAFSYLTAGLIWLGIRVQGSDGKRLGSMAIPRTAQPREPIQKGSETLTIRTRNY